MKNYYVKFTNGKDDFLEARNDCSAWTKACKMKRKQDADIAYLAEQLEDTEEDRVIYRRINNV